MKDEDRLEDTHQRLLKLKYGDVVHFDHMEEGQMDFNSFKMLNLVKADTAVVYRYQPRKKILWLKFDHVENGTYRDNLLPFKLQKILTMNLYKGKESECGQC